MQETNEQSSNQTIEITDLIVETKVANEVRGGQNSSAVVSLGKLGRVENQTDQMPGTTLNHNETTVSDESEDEDEAEAAAFDDLSVSNNEQVIGGFGVTKVGPGTLQMQSSDSLSTNHNETTASDEDDTETAQLPDLAISEEQAEQTKGGLPAVQKVREAASRIE